MFNTYWTPPLPCTVIHSITVRSYTDRQGDILARMTATPSTLSNMSKLMSKP